MTNTIAATRLTILLPAGRLPLALMAKAHELAEKYQLEIYLSTLQNLRLMGIREEDLPAIRAELAALGAQTAKYVPSTPSTVTGREPSLS